MKDSLRSSAEQVTEACGNWPLARDYILSLLFLRFLSERHEEVLAAFRHKYRGDEIRIARAMSRERFILPEGCSFTDLLPQSTLPNLGEKINTLLKSVEKANPENLVGVFGGVDFNHPGLGSVSERNLRIRNLLSAIASIKADTSEACVSQWLASLWDLLLEQFAEESARRHEPYHTPNDLADLMTRLVTAVPGDCIYDPACGSGELLTQAAHSIGHSNFALFGHESNSTVWALCRMKFALEHKEDARIINGDPLRSPLLTRENKLRKFQVILCDPSFYSELEFDNLAHDPFSRFKRGIPSRKSNDYAFISHIVESMDPEVGRACLVSPLGVLFRCGSDGLIRRRLIEDGLIEGVVRLPANLFFGTAIPVVLLIFSARRADRSVHFIDASQQFANDRNRNRLRPADINKILSVWKHRKEEPEYSRVVSFEEIEGNEFNLNVSLYLKRQTEEFDPDELRLTIASLEEKISEARVELWAAIDRLQH